VNKKTLFSLIIISCCALLAGKDLLLPGFWGSHDGFAHVARLAQFDSVLKSGQFPVRWLPDHMAGYGSPVFNFNFSAPYYLGTVIYWIGFSYEGSIKVLLLLSLILSGWAMYLLIKELTNNELASIVAAILYIWSPYRFTDIYIRGALGECISFVFFPLIIWCVIKVYKIYSLSPPDNKKQNNKLAGGSKGFIGKSFDFAPTNLYFRRSRDFAQEIKLILITGIVWSLFILSHNIMVLIGAGIYFGLIFFLGKNLSHLKKLVKFAGISFILGLCLSASFWLPAIFEKKYDQMSSIKNIYQLKDQFISLSQIVIGKWQYGLAKPFSNDSMSFELGLINIAVILFLGIFIIRNIITNRHPELLLAQASVSGSNLTRSRIRQLADGMTINKEYVYDKVELQNDILIKMSIFTILLFIFSIFMCLPISKFIYNISFISGVINFPWRFLEIATLFSSIAGGLVVNVVLSFPRSASRRRESLLILRSPIRSGMTVGGLIIILALALNWNKAQIVSSRFSYSDSFYAKTYLTNNVTFFDTEYLPVWANYFGILDHKGVAWDGSASSPFFQSKTEIQVKDFQKPSASSLSRVYRETQGKMTYSATIENNQETVVQAQQFYFPGWRAWVDNLEVKVNPDEFGLVSFPVPIGNHNIKVAFTDTLVRRIGNWVSGISTIGIILYMLLSLSAFLKALADKFLADSKNRSG